MLRQAIPLLLAAAAVAAGAVPAHAQDRYGPDRGPALRPASADRPPALRTATAPAPIGLRTLSWAGKVEMRREQVAAPPAAYANAAPLRRAPSGRYPGMNRYAAPSEGAWTPPPATTAAPQAAQVTLPPAPPYASATSSPPAGAPYAGPYAPAPPRAGVGAVGAPIYAPGPQPIASRSPIAQTPQTPDPLPAPTAGRYGYVGPGRSAEPVRAIPPRPTPAPTPARVEAAASTADPAMPGPPRPPVYARAYVQPTGTQPGGEGARRYSIHRQYGLEPDPVPVPPQFFSPAADMSAPETEPAVSRMGPASTKAAVNAARLQAAGG